MTRRRAVVAIWTLPSAILLAATALTYHAVRIPPPDRLDDDARAAVIAPLRAALDATATAPSAPSPPPPPVDTAAAAPLALVATVWSNGRAIARVDGRGDDLATAARRAAAAFATATAIRRLAPGDRAAARIQVDVIAGRGPLGGASPLLDAVALPGVPELLAIQPGVDGIGGDVDGREVLLLPHELVDARLVSARQPSASVAELAIGVDLARIATVLAQRDGPHHDPASQLFRFRTDAFVERAADGAAGHAGSPLPLTRGQPPHPPVTSATLRAGALAGGRYLVAHLAPSGRFVYEHDLSNGRDRDPDQLGGNYSMPRHAGTTYFLAELYRITREPWLREPIERASAHMIALVDQSRCGGAGAEFDCVLDRGETRAQLGSTALGVVALVEYQRATGDHRYLDRARRLAEFLMFMQRPDGSFRHLYDPTTGRADDRAELLYYSGEATLALARLHAITGDARYRDAAVRGLDWLVDWYDFFLGGFFYGEEHWTCIAAEALWPYAADDRYRAFCDGYADFLRDQQAAVGDLPGEDDLAGAYDVTAFVPPYNTPAGSRTEAMVSAFRLDVLHGHADPAIPAQIEAALGYLLGQQLRPDSDFAATGVSDGGIAGSPIDRTVRIDYVQHVCSAMIRGAEALDLPLQSSVGSPGAAGR